MSSKHDLETQLAQALQDNLTLIECMPTDTQIKILMSAATSYDKKLSAKFVAGLPTLWQANLPNIEQDNMSREAKVAAERDKLGEDLIKLAESKYQDHQRSTDEIDRLTKIIKNMRAQAKSILTISSTLEPTLTIIKDGTRPITIQESVDL